MVVEKSNDATNRHQHQRPINTDVKREETEEMLLEQMSTILTELQEVFRKGDAVVDIVSQMRRFVS